MKREGHSFGNPGSHGPKKPTRWQRAAIPQPPTSRPRLWSADSRERALLLAEHIPTQQRKRHHDDDAAGVRRERWLEAPAHRIRERDRNDGQDGDHAGEQRARPRDEHDQEGDGQRARQDGDDEPQGHLRRRPRERLDPAQMQHDQADPQRGEGVDARQRRRRQGQRQARARRHGLRRADPFLQQHLVQPERDRPGDRDHVAEQARRSELVGIRVSGGRVAVGDDERPHDGQTDGDDAVAAELLVQERDREDGGEEGAAVVDRREVRGGREGERDEPRQTADRQDDRDDRHGGHQEVQRSRDVPGQFEHHPGAVRCVSVHARDGGSKLVVVALHKLAVGVPSGLKAQVCDVKQPRQCQTAMREIEDRERLVVAEYILKVSGGFGIDRQADDGGAVRCVSVHARDGGSKLVVVALHKLAVGVPSGLKAQVCDVKQPRQCQTAMREIEDRERLVVAEYILKVSGGFGIDRQADDGGTECQSDQPRRSACLSCCLGKDVVVERMALFIELRQLDIQARAVLVVQTRAIMIVQQGFVRGHLRLTSAFSARSICS
nr:hypothetical protein CFP56_24025 [Quercus suber]